MLTKHHKQLTLIATDVLKIPDEQIKMSFTDRNLFFLKTNKQLIEDIQ